MRSLRKASIGIGSVAAWVASINRSSLLLTFVRMRFTVRLNNIGLAIKHAKAAILFMSGATQRVLEDIDTAVSKLEIA